MKKVLVSGGAGFIGSHLVDRLHGQGHQVLVIDDLSTGRRENVPDTVEFHQLDVRDPKTAGVILAYRPDTVFHLAAQKNVRYSLEHPDDDAAINVVGSVALLEAARRAGVKQFIFTSTGGAIYDESAPRPTAEAGLARPLSPYGISKLSFEHYLDAYHAVYGLETLSLRLSNVYGPRQDPKGEAGVVAIFLSSIFHNARPPIFGDGSHTRDYVYVADVADACVQAAEQPKSGAFNIGTGRETSVRELWNLIAQATKTALEPAYGKENPGELHASSLDARAAKAAFGWEPKTDLETGIQQTTEWFRAQVTPGD